MSTQPAALTALVAHIAERIQLAAPRIVVLGDVMLDRFIDGATHRLSPEAPVPVVEVHHDSATVGGAAMVGRVVRSLGGSCHLLGVVGDDANGHLVRRLAGDEMATSLVEVPGRPTTEKCRVRVEARHLLRIDREVTTPVGEAVERELLAALLAALDGAGALVLSDYAKGVLSPSLCAAAIAAAQQRGLPVLADPKHADLTRYVGATCITPNRHEAVEALAHMTGATFQHEPPIAELVAGLQPLVAPSAVAVTAGEHGLYWATGAGASGGDGDGSVCGHIEAPPVRVADVTGAGDVVVAAAALALATGHTLADALAAAALAATTSVTFPGTRPPTWADVLCR